MGANNLSKKNMGAKKATGRPSCLSVQLLMWLACTIMSLQMCG
ncbi:hypothetical protein SETIT_2G086000v2 [Setaria italica]|uniref:Uncharacterized protein n=1 Tax=Setaria italica TaxID=4555 RepID=A0A368PWY5_SETIT|nr:hypothetical protein SETIT_2G086000v2 [Setaria italica]